MPRLDVTVNGKLRRIEADVRLLLVELLRDRLRLTGTKIGCRTGDCGACTIWLDGKLTKSCMVLAVAANGSKIVTLEGAQSLSPRVAELQQSFLDHNGFQCGYCLSGMILSAADLLETNPQPDDAAIRKAISGNLCRCTGYDSIVAAVQAVAKA